MPTSSPENEPQRPTINLRDVHKAFGDKKILIGTNLAVATGDSLVIVGGSGTGKSVLLKHIIGLLKPDSGEVLVDGVSVPSLKDRELTHFRRRFGMAFQEGALFDSMNVRDNISFALRRLGGTSASEIRDRVEECLAKVRLAGVGDKMPSELSGGMRRRVGFARAIVHRPKILLFDEPTTGLDPVTKATIDELIVELQEDLGSTSVTISHDLVSVFRIADQVAMLFKGQIIAQAPPDEFKRLDDGRIQQFLRGESEGPFSA